jgi:GH24 family phage-related lysozyme (muramidase)
MTPAEFIAKWEGFSSSSYFDVNHYRIGYGSDTEGPDEINVVQGMTTTKPRALQNLALRIPKYTNTIVHQIGAAAWDKQAENEQAALLSLTYNYGSLPPSVVRAIMTDDPENIAAAIRILQGANSGVNRKRRLGEAQFYLTGTSVAPVKPGLSPISKGAIVVGTGAGGGAAASAANGQIGQALIMAVISMASYLISAMAPAKPRIDPSLLPETPVVTRMPQPATPPAGPPIPLSPLDDYVTALQRLKEAQAVADAKRKVLVDYVDKENTILNSVDLKIIEHQPIEGK